MGMNDIKNKLGVQIDLYPIFRILLDYPSKKNDLARFIRDSAIKETHINAAVIQRNLYVSYEKAEAILNALLEACVALELHEPLRTEIYLDEDNANYLYDQVRFCEIEGYEEEKPRAKRRVSLDGNETRRPFMKYFMDVRRDEVFSEALERYISGEEITGVYRGVIENGRIDMPWTPFDESIVLCWAIVKDSERRRVIITKKTCHDEIIGAYKVSRTGLCRVTKKGKWKLPKSVLGLFSESGEEEYVFEGRGSYAELMLAGEYDDSSDKSDGKALLDKLRER